MERKKYPPAVQYEYTTARKKKPGLIHICSAKPASVLYHPRPRRRDGQVGNHSIVWSILSFRPRSETTRRRMIYARLLAPVRRAVKLRCDACRWKLSRTGGGGRRDASERAARGRGSPTWRSYAPPGGNDRAQVHSCMPPRHAARIPAPATTIDRIHTDSSRSDPIRAERLVFSARRRMPKCPECQARAAGAAGSPLVWGRPLGTQRQGAGIGGPANAKRKSDTRKSERLPGATYSIAESRALVPACLPAAAAAA